MKLIAIILILTLISLTLGCTLLPVNFVTNGTNQTLGEKIDSSSSGTNGTKAINTKVQENATVIDEVPSIPVPNISAPQTQTYTVNVVDTGFEVPEIRINVGDTVAWQNVREGKLSKALILGTYQCARIRSGFFFPGEVFTWTFDKPMTCLIVDGIYTTQSMSVVVE